CDGDTTERTDGKRVGRFQLDEEYRRERGHCGNDNYVISWQPNPSGSAGEKRKSVRSGYSTTNSRTNPCYTRRGATSTRCDLWHGAARSDGSVLHRQLPDA